MLKIVARLDSIKEFQHPETKETKLYAGHFLLDTDTPTPVIKAMLTDFHNYVVGIEKDAEAKAQAAKAEANQPKCEEPGQCE